jgi:hypothetical protein
MTEHSDTQGESLPLASIGGTHHGQHQLELTFREAGKLLINEFLGYSENRCPVEPFEWGDLQLWCGPDWSLSWLL